MSKRRSGQLTALYLSKIVMNCNIHVHSLCHPYTYEMSAIFHGTFRLHVKAHLLNRQWMHPLAWREYNIMGALTSFWGTCPTHKILYKWTKSITWGRVWEGSHRILLFLFQFTVVSFHPFRSSLSFNGRGHLSPLPPCSYSTACISLIFVFLSCSFCPQFPVSDSINLIRYPKRFSSYQVDLSSCIFSRIIL